MTVNAYTIYKVMELVIFLLFLFYVYLLIQIWFLWKDADKKELLSGSYINDFFFRKNFLYVVLFSLFLMMHEFLEEITLYNAQVYFEFFELLALIFLILFAHGWYDLLKKVAHKESILNEITKISQVH